MSSITTATTTYNFSMVGVRSPSFQIPDQELFSDRGNIVGTLIATYHDVRGLYITLKMTEPGYFNVKCLSNSEVYYITEDDSDWIDENEETTLDFRNSSLSNVIFTIRDQSPFPIPLPDSTKIKIEVTYIPLA